MNTTNYALSKVTKVFVLRTMQSIVNAIAKEGKVKRVLVKMSDVKEYMYHDAFGWQEAEVFFYDFAKKMRIDEKRITQCRLVAMDVYERRRENTFIKRGCLQSIINFCNGYDECNHISLKKAKELREVEDIMKFVKFCPYAPDAESYFMRSLFYKQYAQGFHLVRNTDGDGYHVSAAKK